MRIDISPRDTWNVISHQYRAALPFQDPATHVHAYFGYRHALWEATQALARLFSSKKTVAIATESGPAFETIATGLSAEGYTVKALSAAALRSPDTWLPAIQDDLLFTLTADDHPVTGALYKTPELDAALGDQRIFRIKLSHCSFKFTAMNKPAPFEVRILSLATNRALVVAGARARLKPIVAMELPWVEELGERARQDLLFLSNEQIEAQRRAIVEFESNLPSGFKPFFEPDAARVYDRSIIFHQGMDGSAVIEKLGANLKLSRPEQSQPGSELLLETTSLCRWQSPRTAEWLRANGFKDEQIRGLVLIDATLIDPDLIEKLEAAAEEILSLQGGERFVE